MSTQPVILLSGNVCEFNTAADYGYGLSFNQKTAITYEGVCRMAASLEKSGQSATFFTTALFAATEPDLIRSLAHRHEIASLGYYQNKVHPTDLLASRQRLESISGKVVSGFRHPDLRPLREEEVRKAGYLYDASLNPGPFLAGKRPRTPFVSGGVLHVPASVTPRLRIPLFWMSLKTFPFWLYCRLCLQTLRADGQLVLSFNAWELADLRTFAQMPAYLSNASPVRAEARLLALIRFLADHGEFQTVQTWIAGSFAFQGTGPGQPFDTGTFHCLR